MTPRGGSKSHCSEGMAAATFAGGTEEEPDSTQQLQEAPGKGGDDSQDWLAYSEGATQGKAGTSKSKGETGDPPQQAEGEALAPPEEIPRVPNPQTQHQVPARIPLMPQSRYPPKTPPQLTPKTQRKKTHPHLLAMSKVTSRQGKFG